MTTQKARQDQTTHVEGRPRGTTSSAPPPPERDQQLANVDALLKVLDPQTADILKIDFSSDIRTKKRHELPEFSNEPVDRYRLLLAFDEMHRNLTQELGSRNRKVVVVIDHLGGVRTIRSDKHESHRNASLGIGLLQRRMGVPLEVAHEILTSIIALLLKGSEISFSGLCYTVDASQLNVTITHAP